MANLIVADDWELGTRDTTKWGGQAGTIAPSTAQAYATAKTPGRYSLAIAADGVNNYYTLNGNPVNSKIFIHMKLMFPAMAVIPNAVYCRPIYFSGVSYLRVYIRRNAASGTMEAYLESFGAATAAYELMTAYQDAKWNDIKILGQKSAASWIECNGVKCCEITGGAGASVLSYVFGNYSVGNWGETFWVDRFQMWDDYTDTDYFEDPVIPGGSATGQRRSVLGPGGIGGM